MEVQASPGRPVQPRFSERVEPKAGKIPHGAVLIAATSVLSESFDPLISRPVTDTTQSEPSFTAEGWFPAQMWTVNRLGDEVRLVVVPAQFQGTELSGELRRFTRLAFEVTYTDTTSVDFTPPIIWTVESVAHKDQAGFGFSAQDSSGIQRVLIAHTQDGTTWESTNLAHNVSEDRWETTLTGLSDQLVYFVQVVDGAGNVTVTSNKGLYFEPNRFGVYLPTVLRDHS